MKQVIEATKSDRGNVVTIYQPICGAGAMRERLHRLKADAFLQFCGLDGVDFFLVTLSEGGRVERLKFDPDNLSDLEAKIKILNLKK